MSSNEGIPVEIKANEGADGDGMVPAGGRPVAFGVRRTNGISSKLPPLISLVDDFNADDTVCSRVKG